MHTKKMRTAGHAPRIIEQAFYAGATGMGEHAFYAKHVLGNNNILMNGGHGAGV